MASTARAAALLAGMAGMFSREGFPADCAKALISAPEIPSSGWSLGNRMLAALAGTRDARGIRQWRDAGRHVRKGSRAAYILVPRVRTVADGEDGAERQAVTGFASAPVFRYEDTEGAALPRYEPRRLPPLYGLARMNGIDVEYASSRRGEAGSIGLASGRMTLSTEAPDTFLHEMVHWYDGRLRGGLAPGQDPEQEAVAQLGACVLASMYGHDARGYTWNYIAYHAGSRRPEDVGAMCFRVMGRTQKAVEAMLADAGRLGGQADGA